MRKVYEVLCIEDIEESCVYILQGWSEVKIVANWVCGRELMAMPDNDYCVVRNDYNEEKHTKELYMAENWIV